MSNSNNKVVSIVIKGKDMAGQAFSSVSSKMKKAKLEANEFNVKIKDFAKSTKTLGKDLGAKLTLPITALGVVAIKGASDLVTLEDSYKRLSETMNIASEEMMKKMREVSKGTINNKDLILSANKAMSLGVIKTTEDMATLMEIARVKGQNMGLSMTQAFDDLVTGLGRGSAMILDNLGITIKVGEINEEYAKKLNKTVQELTSAEQKQALVNAVVSEGKAEMEAMGEIQTTNKEKIEQFTTALMNFKDELGKEMLPVATRFLEKATQWTQKFQSLNEGHRKLIIVIGLLVAGIAPLLLAVSALSTGLTALIALFGFLLSPIGLVAVAIAGLVTAGVLLYKNWDTVKEKLKEIWGSIEQTWFSVTDKITGKIQSLIGWFKNLINQIKDAFSWLEKFSMKNITTSFKNLPANLGFGGARANGGLVETGKAYLVGERGAEMFVPRTNGTIVPNNRLGGGKNININVTGNTLLDSRSAEKIGDMIIRRLKTNNLLG